MKQPRYHISLVENLSVTYSTQVKSYPMENALKM